MKTTELDICKTQVMTSPTLRDDFASTVEWYSNFIKQMKAEKPQLNISEVSFAHGKGGKNSFGKWGSSGISNVSNAAVDDRFFENHAYHALTPEQKNTLRLKRLKRGNVGNGYGGSGNENGKGKGKWPTIKSRNHSIAALTFQMMMMMMMNPRGERNVLLTVPTPLWPAKARWRSVKATERQIFQFLQWDWDLLAVWKKETDQTLTHMHGPTSKVQTETRTNAEGYQEWQSIPSGNK
jgi:hypothetical protein